MSAAGFNIVGYLHGHVGLGVAVRSLIDALRARNIGHCVVALAAGQGRDGRFAEYEGVMARSPEDLVYPTNLLVAPPPTIEAAVTWLARFDRPGRKRVAYLYWELEVLPHTWRSVLSGMDAVVVNSRWLRDAMAASLPGTEVVYSPHPVCLPEGVRANRARFGLAEEDFVVSMSFAPGSDVTRKNPLAAVRAFREAFPRAGRAKLLVKVNAPSVTPDKGATLRELEAHAAADPSIRLVTQDLAYEEVLSLYASSDVYVSLHRSEGLGLGMLEAMLLGVPVIATGYSGNMSFMDESSAAIVPFVRVPVESEMSEYRQAMEVGATWAEPDVGAAADWMRRLAGDPMMRTQLAQAGRASARAYVEEGARLPFVDALERLFASRPTPSAAPAPESWAGTGGWRYSVRYSVALSPAGEAPPAKPR